jgi:F-type H+-transporting ATPase subunit b
MVHVLMMAAEEAAHAAEEATKAGLPQMDVSTFPSQIFWLAVTFGALYAAMTWFILPRLGGAIEDRRDRIADDLDQAAEGKRLAEEAERAYNRALGDARAKAQAIAAETREEVGAEIAAQQRAAEASLSARTVAAEASIATMKREASAKVREAARDTTRAIVEALIHETPTDPVIDQAIAKAAR